MSAKVRRIDERRREIEAERAKNAADLSAAVEAAFRESLPRWSRMALRTPGFRWAGRGYAARAMSIQSQWIESESVMLLSVLNRGCHVARFRVTEVGRFSRVSIYG